MPLNYLRCGFHSDKSRETASEDGPELARSKSFSSCGKVGCSCLPATLPWGFLLKIFPVGIVEELTIVDERKFSGMGY